MPIRVAYDISFLAQFVNHPSGQSGVYRTVEELLGELCKQSDVELTAVAASGGNPLFDVANSSLYVAQHDKLGCRFETALTGRFGLSDSYLRSFGGAPPQNAAASPRFSIHPAISQKAKQIFARLVGKMDRTRVSFDRCKYDLFHSPFLKLPPRICFSFRAFRSGWVATPTVLVSRLVPWFVLLSILGLKAMLSTRQRLAGETRSFAQWVEPAAGATLLFLSIFMSAQGALFPGTHSWNAGPPDVGINLERVWDWKDPQFLAGLKGHYH